MERLQEFFLYKKILSGHLLHWGMFQTVHLVVLPNTAHTCGYTVDYIQGVLVCWIFSFFLF